MASLAQPGGNVTGLSSMTSELGKKRLEILKEAFPKLSRVAVLRDPWQPPADLRLAEAGAQALGLRLQILEVRDINDLEALPAAEAQQAGNVDRIGFLGEERNVTIEYRWAGGKHDRLPAPAAALPRLHVDIITTQGTS